MSKQSHRATRRNRHRVHAHDDSDYGVQVGWCVDENGVDDVKRRTHDLLIDNMGDRRTGGVSWSITSGEAAFEKLSTLFANSPSPAHSDSYRRVRGLLREYGGFLVIALAEGIKR